MKFGPERRVRKRHEFQAIQGAGRRVAADHFVFIVARAAHAEQPPRLGITVTRRVGNSVRRSRIKRVVRAAFREKNGFVPVGFDMVVICRKDAPHLDTRTVIDEFERSSRRLTRAISGL